MDLLKKLRKRKKQERSKRKMLAESLSVLSDTPKDIKPQRQTPNHSNEKLDDPTMKSSSAEDQKVDIFDTLNENSIAFPKACENKMKEPASLTQTTLEGQI